MNNILFRNQLTKQFCSKGFDVIQLQYINWCFFLNLFHAENMTTEIISSVLTSQRALGEVLAFPEY